MIIGWDLAPRKCGWCAGAGDQTPVADGFRVLPGLTDDLGMMLDILHKRTLVLIERFRPTVMIIESPILPGGKGPTVMGSLLQRRAQFCMGPHIEWMCFTRGILCQEESPEEIKRELTNDRHADKDAMVAAAEKMGVRLPATKADGREDAADATGAWKVGVRHHARAYLQHWDRKLFSARGALI